MTMAKRFIQLFIGLALMCACARADELAVGFASPPDEARPWVYWFWLNGNVTKEGVTTDLEAMKRVGIGGALIMEVDFGAPPGRVRFGSENWREIFKFACSEAARLGLQINMNNDAGYTGSGGPWIKHEHSMQELTWSEARVAVGGKRVELMLPQPRTVQDYYVDIAVLAFPTPQDTSWRIGEEQEVRNRAMFGTATKKSAGRNATRAVWPEVPQGTAVSKDKILDISDKMDRTGKLTWDVPSGDWTLLRMGHTTTGAKNHPAPKTGQGLECDKLSREAMQIHFSEFIQKLCKDNGPLVGKAFVATHIDSWEVGSGNWSPKFRDDFKRLRGYDPVPQLVTVTGRAVESREFTERFLWDLRQTVSELVVANYAGELRRLANAHGLRLTIEAYGPPCGAADLSYAGQADEPQGEFWTAPAYGRGATVRMSSAGHVYGRNIIGAEAFTSGVQEKWLHHPGSIKSFGDWAFGEGLNRFVIHRYAQQPWVNPKRAPGMCMGPWGLHYERTQTWWEQSTAWHAYLTRCQYMLRQGQFVADVCYLAPEGLSSFDPPREPPFGLDQPLREDGLYSRPGYNFDACPPELVLNSMTVKDGRVVLPSGMSYRVLVLPESETMTPALLAKIKGLVDAGATVIGRRPAKSPGLSNYPACDDEVRKLVDDLWDPGKIITGKKAEQVLHDRGLPPDFAANHRLRWIHRATDNADIYFVANGDPVPVEATCAFRVEGKHPEWWYPESGRIEKAAYWKQDGKVCRVPMHLDAGGSVFVVFRKPTDRMDPVVRILRNGQEIGSVLAAPTALPIRLNATPDGSLQAEISEDGQYEVITATGRKWTLKAADLPKPLEITGPWRVQFPEGWGAPAEISLERLISWSEHPEPGVKYFSGTAVYLNEFDVNASILRKDARIKLDLGTVQVMAHVLLNGTDLGVLWKTPCEVDVTSALNAGRNRIEVRVTNVWANRQIGDEQLPEDSDRQTKNNAGLLKSWPAWLLEGKPSPSGRFTFTSYRLWKKDDPLQPSGLIGPVTLRSTTVKNLYPEKTP